MKISIDWLKDYIALDLPNSDVIEALNSIGILVDDWEETGGDTILELETYANRPDTLGHVGVARELGAALGLEQKKIEAAVLESEENISDHFSVQIWDEDLCPRYCGKIVVGIEVGPSPEWMQERIKAMGLNPVNNVVDVTNYVLFATSQPIHAFDLAKLQGDEIIVRRAKRGETLRTLEGMDVALSNEMLVIADHKRPVALAGIIGGEESAVTEDTEAVFIESATFDPVSVRRTWKEVGIQTDASYRFERGADIGFPLQAAELAASLLTQMGGRAYRGVLDVYPKARRAKSVILRHHRITELLGVEVERDFVVRTLAKLKFGVTSLQPGTWRISVPSFRVDIEREADLIEEIARFFGYENIPARLPSMETIDLKLDHDRMQEAELRELLFHHGFDEVVNFSFSDPVKQSLFPIKNQAVAIRNPISSRAAHLRTTLLDGLFQSIAWNRNRGSQGVHIFEIGNIFSRNDSDIQEQHRLGMATWGELEPLHWQRDAGPTDFFHLKGSCERLMQHLGYGPVVFRKQDHPVFEEGYALMLLCKGAEAGVLGRVKSSILEDYGIEEPVWALEIDLDTLFDLQIQGFKFNPVARYPSVARDVSFLVGQEVSYQEIQQTIETLNLPHLERFDLYDRYTGPSVPQGKVSLSIRLTFRHSQRTLLAEEVDALQQKIMKALQTGFDLHLRQGGKN